MITEEALTDYLMFKIRKYQQSDAPELRALFFNTIRKVNISDYSENQVKAWAPDEYDQVAWNERLIAIDPFVVMLEGKIVGYADIQNDGYIDHFFCHHQYQGKGIGKTLMNALIKVGIENGITRFYSHVSITAKSFFEHFGFDVIKQQSVEIRGQILTNYVVEKIV